MQPVKTRLSFVLELSFKSLRAQPSMVILVSVLLINSTHSGSEFEEKLLILTESMAKIVLGKNKLINKVRINTN